MEGGMKKCSKCKEAKLLEEFSPCVTNPDGYQYYCKSCKDQWYQDNSQRVKQNQKRLYEQNKIRNSGQSIPVGSKICYRCKQSKLYSEFYVSLGTFDGYDGKCKKCAEAYQKENEIKNKNQPIRIGNKTCCKCKISKLYVDFCKHSRTPDGYRYMCRECERNYRNSRLEQIRQCSQSHRLETNKRNRDRYANDITFRLRLELRNRPRMGIKSGQKAGSFVSDLGCAIAEYKLYLEYQFYPNPVTGEMMSWENHGLGKRTWQIDHIIPLCHFNLTDRSEFLEASHWTNMRPLWFEDHIKKSTHERR